MFVIEKNDFEAFSKVFLEIQDEIDIPFNIIFTNDENLFSQANLDFVKRSDPDIILNLSTIEDNLLSNYFDIFSVKPITYHYKIARFGTQLQSFTKVPGILNQFWEENDNLEVLSAPKLENSFESLFICINFGCLDNSLIEHLPFSLFKKIKPKYLNNFTEALSVLHKNEDKFINLTNSIGGFGGSGHGSSIYELSYNNEGLFDKKEKNYLIVSKANDFVSISFFWNSRSYYSNSNIAWIPVDLISDISSVVTDGTVFITFDLDIKNRIEELYPQNQISQPENLQFQGRNERWCFFEQTHTINIVDNSYIVQHPIEKSFSDLGFAGAYVLETRGLKEFTYPKRRNLGLLFTTKRDNYNFPLISERFTRISELGLSKYILELSPFGNSDISEEIFIPDFEEVVRHFFRDLNYEIENTTKSSLLEQSINLLGGINKLKIISNKKIFELLVSLTPKVRSEAIANRLIEESAKITTAEVSEYIAELRDKGAIVFPLVIHTIDDLVTKMGIDKISKSYFVESLQELYNRKVLLRGKHFDCPECNSKLWFLIEDINRKNYCHECTNEINLPIYTGDKQASDYFRLNHLFLRAIDQGQLSTLLLLNVFAMQEYRSFEYKSNMELFSQGTLITDIDLFLKIGKKIGVAECKSTGGFSKKQVSELIRIATELKCDFIAFSSLVTRDSQEVKDLVENINNSSINVPAFIFTQEVLFNPKSNMIHRHFEMTHPYTSFTTGAIIIN